MRIQYMGFWPASASANPRNFLYHSFFFPHNIGETHSFRLSQMFDAVLVHRGICHLSGRSA